MMSARKLMSLIAVLGSLSTTLPAAATQWAEANGIHLRYELSGHGQDTVVLLHEVSTSLESWDFIVPELERTHRVLRYDLRGFGLSERTRGTLTMDDEMQDLRGLLDVLGIHERVTLVGGAIGGAIALNFAAAHPGSVKGVVAISPAAYLKRGGLGGNTTSNAAASGSPPSAGAGAPTTSPLEAAYPLSLQQAHPDRIARFRAIQAAADQTSSVATIPAAYNVAFADVLPQIQCPVLIVATSMWIRPVSSFKELADAIPHGEFTVIDTGHFAAMESPELVIPVLEKFLDKRAARWH